MSARVRPRFRMRVDMSPDDVMQVFAARKAEGAPCVLHLYEHQVEFSIRQDERHFWSPFLNLLVEQKDDAAVLSGKYGPNINVWTMFLAAYVATSIVGLVALFIGWTQLRFGEPASGLTVSAICAAVLAVVYVFGRIGRALAHPQMVIFHDFIEAAFTTHIVEIFDDETD